MTDAPVRMFTSPLGGDLRILQDDCGAIHFVTADVARQLGHDNAARIDRLLEDYEKGSRIVDTPGGPQRMSTITESGLYTAALRSRRPEAEPFKRWVTEEVLPTIRRTGGAYVAPGSEAELVLRGDPYGGLDLLIATAIELRDARNKAMHAESQVKALAPKAAEFDTWQSSNSGVRMVEFAKALGMTQNATYGHLRDIGVLFRQRINDGSGRFFHLPKAGFEHLFKQIREPIPTGEYVNVLLVTPEGEVRLRKMLKDSGRVQSLRDDIGTD